MPTRQVTTITISEVVAKLLPAVGALVRSPHPNSKAVHRIVFRRRLVSQAGRVRVGLEAVRKAQVPEGAEVPPWPRLAVGRPKSAAESIPRRPSDIEPVLRRQNRQRDRAVQLLADDRDKTRTVPTVRLGNDNVVEGEWRDPDDLDRNRRTPRVIHGVKTWDVIDYLLKLKSITRKQGRAARRIRDQHERAVHGVRLGYERLSQTPGGFGPSAGPTEARSKAYEEYEIAKGTLGDNLWGWVELIVVQNRTLEEAGKRRKMHHNAAKNSLSNALDRLSEHYKEIDDAKRKENAASA